MNQSTLLWWHIDAEYNHTQHNDTQHNNIQHNDTQNNDIKHNNKNVELSITTHCIMTFNANTEWCHPKCHLC